MHGGFLWVVGMDWVDPRAGVLHRTLSENLRRMASICAQRPMRFYSAICGINGAAQKEACGPDQGRKFREPALPPAYGRAHSRTRAPCASPRGLRFN